MGHFGYFIDEWWDYDSSTVTPGHLPSGGAVHQHTTAVCLSSVSPLTESQSGLIPAPNKKDTAGASPATPLGVSSRPQLSITTSEFETPQAATPVFLIHPATLSPPKIDRSTKPHVYKVASPVELSAGTQAAISAVYPGLELGVLPADLPEAVTNRIISEHFSSPQSSRSTTRATVKHPLSPGDDSKSPVRLVTQRAGFQPISNFELSEGFYLNHHHCALRSGLAFDVFHSDKYEFDIVDVETEDTLATIRTNHRLYLFGNMKQRAAVLQTRSRSRYTRVLGPLSWDFPSNFEFELYVDTEATSP